jgi:hypothetical protein
VLSLVRSDPAEGTKLTRLVEQAWADVVHRILADFESVRKPGAPSVASLELLAYGTIGAHHNASLRASWDDKFSREDLITNHLWLFLAILAAVAGEVDIDSRMARYKDLIKEVAGREPATPPAIEG